MSAPGTPTNTSKMVLDFPGWVGDEEKAGRGSVGAAMANAKDQATMQKTLTSQFWLSEQTKIPVKEVQRNWSVHRRAWAKRLGFEGAEGDDVKFHAFVTDRTARERDKDYYRFGEEGNTETAAKSRDESLASKAYNAGANFSSRAEMDWLEFQKWQEGSKSASAYDPRESDRDFDIWRIFFHEGMSDKEIAAPAAEKAYGILAQSDDKFRAAKEAVPFFRGMTDAQIKIAMKGISQIAKEKGSTVAGHNAAEEMAIAFGRTLRDVGSKIARGAERDAVDLGYGHFPMSFEDSPPADFFTPERRAAYDKYAEKQRADIDLESKLAKLADASVNAIQRESWGAKMRLGTAESLANMGVIAIPYAGAVAQTLAYREDARQNFRDAGIPDSQANALSWIVGPANAALDKVELRAFTGKFPGMTRWMERWSSKGVMQNLGMRLAGAGAAEMAAETAQNHFTEAAAQEIGSWFDKEIPGAKWAEVSKEAWAQAPDTFLAMMPLILVGGGAATYRDFKNFRDLAGDPLKLEAAGFKPAHIREILKTTTDKEAMDAVRKFYPDRDKEAGAGAIEKLRGETAGPLLPAPVTPSDAPKIADEGETTSTGTPTVRELRLDDNGWYGELDDGSRINVGTVEAALHLREDLQRAHTAEEAEAMVGIAEATTALFAKEGQKSSQTFSGDRVTVQGGEATRTTPGGKVEPMTFNTAGSVAELNRELAMAGADTALIQGSNWIAEDGRQMIATHQTVEGALTQVHEVADRRFSTVFGTPEVAMQRASAASRVLVDAGLFNLEQQRTPADKAFAERVQRVASGQASHTEARETMTELMVANWVGRRKDGSNFAAGHVSAAVDGAVKAVRSKEEMKALGWFRSMLRAVRQYLRGVFSVAAKLQKGVREGKLKKGDDFDRFVDEIFGVSEQRRHNEGTAKEAGVEPEKNEAFSLSSSGALEALATRFENTKLPPEKRLRIYTEIAEQLRGISRAIKFNDANETAVEDLEGRHAFDMGAAREDGASRAELEKLELRQRAEMAALKAKTEAKELKRSLQILDSMLMKLPAEIRSKVGGFTTLADLTTDAARLKFFEDRAAKIHAVLEKFLQGEYDERMTALVARANKNAAEAGKKPASSIGADAHALISAMGAAIEMSEAEVAAELARLDSLIAGDTLTPEQEALAMRQRELVSLAGDWKNLDAADRAAAYEAARETFEEGFQEWAGKIIAKRERREGWRGNFKTDTGKAGTLEERQARAERDLGWKGKLKNIFLGLSSFREAMEYVFGGNSVAARDFTNREREASNAKEDAVQAIGDKVSDWFTEQAGGSAFKGTELQWKLSQPSIDAGRAGKLSETQAIQALFMWAQKDGQRHMEAFGYDQDWADDLQGKLSPEGRALQTFLRGLYDAEYKPLNALYRERHGVNLPSHDNYAPLTVKPMVAKSGEIVDPVTGGAIGASLLTPGSLRTRSRVATAEPEFRDALQTFLAHTRQLEHWKKYYDLATDMQATLAHRDVSNSVEAAGGKQSADVLLGWTNFFAQGGNRDAAAFLSLNQTLSKASGRAAEMILFGRVGTLLIQSTQLGAALAEMPTGAYVKRFGQLFAGKLGWGEALKSEYIQRRFKQAPPVVRQAMDALAATEPNRIKHAARELGKLIAGADALFTAGTYAITYSYHRMVGEKMGLTGAELDEHAHREAERSTDRVAQPTRQGARSLFENTTTGAMARIGWAFASESRQKIALAAWAAREAKKDLPKFLRTVGVVWGAGGLAAALIRSAWRDMKDDDDEEVFDAKNWSPARMAAATAAGPLQGVPVFGDMLEGLLTTAAGGYNPDGDIFSQAGQGATAAKKLITGKTIQTVSEKGKVTPNDEPVEDTLKAAKAILFTIGLFNDTIAGANSLLNVAEDGAKVVDNLNGVESGKKGGK